MASYDSADLLAQFKELAGLPTATEITSASIYARLARAQLEVIEDIAGIYPNCLYRTTGPAALSTTDSKVFTFGTDGSGYAVAPMGFVRVFRSLGDYPDNPMLPGIDYLDEGTQIRIPNNRTESSTLYWQGIATPTDISASQEPALRPAPARRLIVIKAVETFGREGGSRYDMADDCERLYAREFGKHMLVWKTRFTGGGALLVTDKWGGATDTLRT